MSVIKKKKEKTLNMGVRVLFYDNERDIYFLFENTILTPHLVVKILEH
jgi:hypothetical protein